MCSWFGGPWAGGWFGGGMLMMLLFWGLIIWAGVLLFRKLLSQPSQDNRLVAVSGTAHEILKERYAKGEISRDEFEQMRKDIL